MIAHYRTYCAASIERITRTNTRAKAPPSPTEEGALVNMRARIVSGDFYGRATSTTEERHTIEVPPLEVFMRLFLVTLLTLAVSTAWMAPPAYADVASTSTDDGDDGGDDDEDDDDDKGCSTAAGPVSMVSLLLGFGLVLTQRRRDTL